LGNLEEMLLSYQSSGYFCIISFLKSLWPYMKYKGNCFQCTVHMKLVSFLNTNNHKVTGFLYESKYIESSSTL
jgi:hypothetical protein